MEFTARMIAQLLGGSVEGDENIVVNDFAKIEEGRKGALSFLANPKYTHYIYDSASSVILVANDFVPERPVSATLVRVENPYNAISQLLSVVDGMINRHPSGIEQPCHIAEGVALDGDSYVGAFAYVGKNVRLGRAVKIYPQCYIGHDVEIGDGTVVYPGAKIYHGAKIGKHCVIHAGAVIGADGFGFAPRNDGRYDKIPQLGNVVLGDYVEIGANTTVDRATMGSTRIGDGTKLDNLVQIGHNVTIGNDTVMSAQVGIAGSTHVGDNCMFAGQVGVAGHITIGDRVRVGAQSGIPNSVASDSTVMGYPALPGAGFARQAAMLRRLSDLFDRVRALEKK